MYEMSTPLARRLRIIGVGRTSAVWRGAEANRLADEVEALERERLALERVAKAAFMREKTMWTGSMNEHEHWCGELRMAVAALPLSLLRRLLDEDGAEG